MWVNSMFNPPGYLYNHPTWKIWTLEMSMRKEYKSIRRVYFLFLFKVYTFFYVDISTSIRICIWHNHFYLYPARTMYPSVIYVNNFYIDYFQVYSTWKSPHEIFTSATHLPDLNSWYATIATNLKAFLL